jgi:hypothetical protein
MREFIKKFFSSKGRKEVRSIINRTKSTLYANNLNTLAKIWRTDKWGEHWYTQHYHSHFRNIRKKKLNVFEIGVGGYEDPLEGGNSLRTWKYYFPKSNIFSIDIHDKSQLQEKRIKIFQGSQTNEEFLQDVCEQIGNIDIIIDDGSHINSHVIKTFEILFPKLSDNGIYVIEDLESSYWPSMGGDSLNFSNPGTSMNFLKSLIDGLNYKEFIRPGYKPTYYDLHIIALHFYHNMAFIIKGKNNEESINIVNNEGFRPSFIH